MSAVTFEQNNLPGREEMNRLFEEMRQRDNPVEDLIELTQTLTRLEQQYDMTSARFFEKYQRGEMGDAADFVKWAGHYHLYLDLKRKIELSLEKVLA